MPSRLIQSLSPISKLILQIQVDSQQFVGCVLVNFRSGQSGSSRMLFNRFMDHRHLLRAYWEGSIARYDIAPKFGD